MESFAVTIQTNYGKACSKYSNNLFLISLFDSSLSDKSNHG